MKVRNARFLMACTVALLAAGGGLWQEYGTGALFSAETGAGHDERIAAAFANRESDLQVTGSGTVIKVLPDDNQGSRHQRFIIELDSGQSLLVAHNIDLAPRIPGLRTGDRVGFHGEYEWNERGGVLHWTHHDPRGKHPDGWLEHAGRTYR